MDENNRLNRRSRPRPFDLRRKVLLKNFLREQMTYIPPTGEMSQISLEVSNGTNVMDGSSFSTDTIQKQETANDENNADILTSLSEPGPSSSVSLVNDIKSELNQHSDVSDSANDGIDKNTAESSVTAISRFSSIIRSRSKRKKKGIAKAKLICKPVKSPEKAKSETVRFGNMFRRKSIIQYKQPLGANLRKKSASKSFFSLFKARKSNKKQDKSVASAQNLSSVNKDCESSGSTESCSTSTQAVQTDLTWSSNELNEIEQSNRLLREENRLLSDSLSYFMSDARTNFNNGGHETINQSHDLNSRTLESLPFNNHLGAKQLFYSPDTARKGLILRSKVLRSKSVQERSKSDTVRICHRTRSMNYHEGTRNNFISNFPSRPSREPSFQQIGARTRSSTDRIRNLGSPNNRRVPVLRAFPLNNSRVLQRRSSMPERANLENVRLAYRRPHSVRDYNRPKPAVPFRVLPTEAFY